MSVETEKKYRLGNGDRKEVEDALAECGAEFVGREFEENIIFSSPELAERSSIIRIRNVGNRCVLTFKRRVESQSDIKEQIEHETTVEDPKEMSSILHELGYRPTLVYEKKRDTWKLRGVEVVLDELPFGHYMEIEGLRTSIKEAEMLLGIEHLEAELETYPRLTTRLGTRLGDLTEARFTSDAT